MPTTRNSTQINFAVELKNVKEYKFKAICVCEPDDEFFYRTMYDDQ